MFRRIAMHFTKMHGAGNDYVYVDCFPRTPPGKLSQLARDVSDRHAGVGADGLILIEPSELADARMRIFNADGSEAGMCGNGLRCVAKYLYDHDIVRRSQLTIETGSRCVTVDVEVRDGLVDRARVDMGAPVLASAEIPTSLPGDPPVNVVLDVDGKTYSLTCVSMRNPHCVLFVEAITDELVTGLGPRLEHHVAFPERANVEFVRVVSANEIEMRVWERGSGETRACGSGACAAVVAGVLCERLERSVAVHLPGGDLDVEWDASGSVFLAGPAVEVFAGEWP